MNGEVEAEKIKLEDDLKNAICQLRMVLRSYDSSKYSVDILAANKVEWIKKVEDCHCNVLRTMFDFHDAKLSSAAVEEKLTKAVDELEKKVIDYITNFNNRILKNNAAELIAADTNYLKIDRVDSDTDNSNDLQAEKSIQIDSQIMDIGSCVTKWSVSVTETMVKNSVHGHCSADVEAVDSDDNLKLLEDLIFALKPNHNRKDYLVVDNEPAIESFQKPVCVNYYERGKSDHCQARFEICSYGHCAVIIFPDLKLVVSHNNEDQLYLCVAASDCTAETGFETELSLTWSDVTPHLIIFTTHIKWETLPHSQDRVDPGN